MTRWLRIWWVSGGCPGNPAGRSHSWVGVGSDRGGAYYHHLECSACPAQSSGGDNGPYER